MSTCPQCGTSYPPHVSICSLDGTLLSAPEPAKDPILGTVIAGKYRIDAVLGRGGMGAVYRATHLMLNKTVAVKTIKPDLIESAEMVQRFQREARAATSLDHPNIVAVYDLGQAEDGALYIAMEFVKGVDLKEAIRTSGPMPPTRIVPLLRQVASALARAHRNHIVHRDLKPQNLVIGTDASGEERVKLLDFGIAKSLEDGATPLTDAGFSLGTPHYMAPEQAMGAAVDGRADIYALGVILYEMLVGDVPFNAASAPAVLIKHLNEAPEPPSHRRPDLQIPPALEGIALRCLEKEPARRFQTAEDFAAALERSVAAGAAADAGVVADGDTVMVFPDAGAAPTAPLISSPVPSAPGPAIPVITPTSAATAGSAAALVVPPVPAQTSAAPDPPPLPSSAAATRPTLKAPEAVVAASPAPATTGGGKGGLVAVVLAVAGLFFIALALGGFAAYRAWKSRSAITAESISSAPAPSSVPAMAADTTAAAKPPEPEGHAPAAEPPGQPSAQDASTAAPPSRRADAEGGPVAPPSTDAPPATRGGSTKSAGQAPVPSGSSGDYIGGTPSEPPRPALPKQPPVYFECTGAPDVCGAFTTAFEQALERDGLPRAARPDRAEIIVNARATVLETHEDQQYGTNFTVQTFSLELQGESTRDGMAVSMPAAKTFSFDRRVGRERAAEQGRLVAGEALDRIQKFWTKRLGG